jgi:hypothetical protein
MVGLLFLALSAIYVNPPVWAGEVPVGSPISEQLFMISRELYGRGILSGLEYADLYYVGDSNFESETPLQQLYDLLSKPFLIDESSPRLSANIWLLSKSRFGGNSKSYLKAFPNARMNFGRGFSANILYRIDGELTEDPRYGGKSWKGISGLAENATIEYERESFQAQFGVERVSWGYGNYGNLMFSNQAMPMTVLGFAYHKWFIDFESVIGFLNPLKDQLDQMEGDTSFFTSQQRYLSAHSLTLKPLRDFSLSLREVVLYGGPGRRLEPTYIFPFIWYHGEQLNSRLDDNTMFGLAADYRFSGPGSAKAWLYGEMLIDDYQADSDTRGDYEPNQLGYLGGIEVYDLPVARLNMGLEYARVNNWTFNQARAHNRYINDNYPIGFPDGPDVDLFDWHLTYWPADFIRLSYSGLDRRHGEGRLNSPWSRPWLEIENYSEPFPTGMVEKTIINSLESTFLGGNRIWGNLRLDFTDINNVENNPDADRRYWELWLTIGLNLPPFSWEL